MHDHEAAFACPTMPVALKRGSWFRAKYLLFAATGLMLAYVIPHDTGGARSFTIAAAVDAVLWMATTGIAMIFILRGKVQEHQQWMTRSFAVALVFLEGRVIGGVTGWENLGDRATETIVWVCLAFSLLAADLVLQWQKPGRSRRSFTLTTDGS